MKLNTIILLLIFSLILLGSFLLLKLNQSEISLNLLFAEIQTNAGLVILASFFLGSLLTILVEILYFYRRKKSIK